MVVLMKLKTEMMTTEKSYRKVQEVVFNCVAEHQVFVTNLLPIDTTVLDYRRVWNVHLL
jgi:hypothetical protein